MTRNLLTVILLLVTTTLFSQNDTAKKHPIDIKCEQCLKADANLTTAGMIKCEIIALKEWDTELNKYYKSLMTTLSPEAKEKLKAAQIKWLDYRDTEILFSHKMYADLKGTMFLVISAGRITEITRQRALDLKAYYDTLTINN
jgi:uncharacterized protein YecT (DUF1311 family)